MSHRSRLAAALIDVPVADHDRATSFWSAALGRPAGRGVTNPEYAELGEATPGLHVMVQATGDDTPRVHLDIETDDIEAEVARLVALGAVVLDPSDHRWTVMRDPTGVVFCVVRVQLPAAFEAHATSWE